MLAPTYMLSKASIVWHQENMGIGHKQIMWGTKVKFKVHNCLCRNQTIPKNEKKIKEISEFGDHPQWFLTFTEMYLFFEKYSALAEIDYKMTLPSFPPARVGVTNNWCAGGAQEVIVKRMNICSTNFYLTSPKI